VISEPFSLSIASDYQIMPANSPEKMRSHGSHSS
jgi:hypothetical protein